MQNLTEEFAKHDIAFKVEWIRIQGVFKATLESFDSRFDQDDDNSCRLSTVVHRP